MGRGRSIGYDEIPDLVRCGISVAAVVCVLVIPIGFGISDYRGDSGVPASLFFATVAGLVAGAVLGWRGHTGRPIRLAGPFTLASAFASLYPISLAVGVSISQARDHYLVWSARLFATYGITAAVAAIPAASAVKVVLRRALLKPLAWTTTVAAVLLTPVWGIGIPILPLACSQWLTLRGYRMNDDAHLLATLTRTN